MNEENALARRSPTSVARLDGFVEPETRGGSPVQKVHRVLRGRYLWAILLAVLLGGSGAFLGWSMATPKYRSTAALHISSTIASGKTAVGEAVLPDVERLIQAHVQVLKSPSVAGIAMGGEAWRGLGRPYGPDAQKEFRDSISVQPQRNAPVLVHFADVDPEAAKLGLELVLEAHAKRALELKFTGIEGELKRLRARRVTLNEKVQAHRDMINGLTKDYGYDPEGIRRELDKGNLAKDGLKTQVEQNQAERRAAVAARGGKFRPLESWEIADEGNVTMQGYHFKVAELEADRSDLVERGYASGSPEVRAVDKKLATYTDLIARLTDRVNKDRKREFDERSDLSRYDQAIEELSEQLRRIDEALEALAVDLGRVMDEQSAMELTRIHLSVVETELDSLERSEKQRGKILVVSPPFLPSYPYSDKRKQLAVLLGMLGAGIGAGFVFLVGYLDGRVRDTGDVLGWLGEHRVLGLVPDFAKEAPNPEDEDLALHCIQRIRTLVEIEFLPENQRTFCITGPNAGAGKSTMSLVLGAALSATGARTLLVDFDLQGRGLTRKVSGLLIERLRGLLATGENSSLNGNGWHPEIPSLLRGATHGTSVRSEAQGLVAEVLSRVDVTTHDGQAAVTILTALLNLALDAKRQGEVRADHGDDLLALGCVWDEEREMFLSTWAVPQTPEEVARQDDLAPFLVETGLPNLSFLRLGKQGARTGDISAASVGAVLRAARERYEVILVDTGPILGALESAIVAAEADRVILTLLRGEPRQTALKALRFLDEIGAEVGGLVLNRATLQDARVTSYTYSYGGKRDIEEDG